MKYLRLSAILAMLTLLSIGALLGNTINVTTTIQAAINTAVDGDIVAIPAGTYNEAVVVNKQITLQGVGLTTIITPPSGNGITVTVSNVTISNLKVTGAADDGISASGVSNLTLTSVSSLSNTASGAQLNNIAGASITSCTFSNNSDEGLNAVGGSNYSLSGVAASGNGSGANGSGINLKGVTGSSNISTTTANSNHNHGLSVGDGATNVNIIDGMFTGNGTAGNAATGAGINISAQGGTTTSNIAVKGTINASTNTTTGIYIYAATSSDAINTVGVGATGTITLSGNGGASGGAGVIVHGLVSNASITGNFTRSTANSAGVINVGTDLNGTNSPTGTVVSGSVFSGYTSAFPAITLYDGQSHFKGNTNVVASGNTGLSETVVYHKIDDAVLGIVIYGVVTNVSSGLQAAINAASAGDYLNVSSGTYNEVITVNKALTIHGVGAGTNIQSPSGNGVTITSDDVILQSLLISNSPNNGILASGRNTLILESVQSNSNTGSGTQLNNCSNVTVTGGTFSNNTDEGFNTLSGNNYTLTNVTASSNGTTVPVNGSGVNLVGIATGSVTNLTASSNHFHGLSIHNGCSNITVSGGTFTLNGIAGNGTTGGGISIDQDAAGTTSTITIQGLVSSTDNKAAGIYIFSAATADAISGVTIGDGTNVVTLTDNGSTGAPNGPGGAGVVVVGNVNTVTISNATFTKGAAPGAGLMVLKNPTNESPSGVSVTGSRFSNYTSADPAVTLDDGRGDASTSIVAATTNTFTFPVAAKVFLQGPYIGGGAMSTALYSNNDIPLSQPYNAAAFGYNGTENVASVPAGVVDWILIELRAVSGGPEVSQRAVLLKSDGTLMDPDGSSSATCTQPLASGYTISDFIVVKHRNHLSVMSATAMTLPAASAYDFTTAQAQAFGSLPMKGLSGGAFGLYVGDFDVNHAINADDLSKTVGLGYLSQSGSAGYLQGDFDLNGAVNADDGPPARANSGTATSVPNP